MQGIECIQPLNPADANLRSPSGHSHHMAGTLDWCWAATPWLLHRVVGSETRRGLSHPRRPVRRRRMTRWASRCLKWARSTGVGRSLVRAADAMRRAVMSLNLTVDGGRQGRHKVGLGPLGSSYLDVNPRIGPAAGDRSHPDALKDARWKGRDSAGPAQSFGRQPRRRSPR